MTVSLQLGIVGGAFPFDHPPRSYLVAVGAMTVTRPGVTVSPDLRTLSGADPEAVWSAFVELRERTGKLIAEDWGARGGRLLGLVGWIPGSAGAVRAQEIERSASAPTWAIFAPTVTATP
jgi:hypothetical protein